MGMLLPRPKPIQGSGVDEEDYPMNVAHLHEQVVDAVQDWCRQGTFGSSSVCQGIGSLVANPICHVHAHELCLIPFQVRIHST